MQYATPQILHQYGLPLMQHCKWILASMEIVLYMYGAVDTMQSEIMQSIIHTKGSQLTF